MIIYNGTKQSFRDAVEQQEIAGILYESIRKKMHRRTGSAELDSWKNSMNYMYIALNDPRIPEDAGIAVEYNIPQTAKRVDFIISGYDTEKRESAVIVELKQWTQLKALAGMDGLVETFTGHAVRTVVHPSYQAWSYAALIRDYNSTVQNEEIGLRPCAWLHNYVTVQDDPLYAEQYRTYLEDAPAFTGKDVAALREFIRGSIVTGDSGRTILEIENGRIRPSKSLQDAIAGMVKGNDEFIMVDDQKVVFEHAAELARQCIADRRKRVMIVRGGPGTGKTVVAVNLLAKLTNEGMFVQYTSKNSAPRNVYLKKLKGKMRKSSVDNMFKGSGSYVDAPKNAVDVILCDEAHRLNERSGIYRNKGENQIMEIIRSALLSVFFIDPDQIVTLNDIGSVTEIRRLAFEQKAEVTEEELASQFRCGGSDGYLSWLDHTLEIRDTADYSMENIDYDIRILDSPEEVRDLIFRRNELSNKSRVLAGYCWNWIPEGKNDPDVYDIRIGDFAMSWNLGSTATWAIDEESVREAGCIHTSQGLEFDYAGVIIGPDMRYEDGHIVTDHTKRAKTDQSLKGIGRLMKEDPEYARRKADVIIKNTYRTLMTRGMKGCYVYCCDAGLSAYLKECLNQE